MSKNYLMYDNLELDKTKTIIKEININGIMAIKELKLFKYKIKDNNYFIITFLNNIDLEQIKVLYKNARM
jgi:hypothetical protein